MNHPSNPLRRNHPVCSAVRLAGGLLAAWVCLTGFAPAASCQTAGPQVIERAQQTVEEASTGLQQAGQAATDKVDELWRRIDERRLKNRKRDEIVAGVIIGLLVGNMVGPLSLPRTTLWQRLGIVAVGLAGAFFGGLAAHVMQLDLGLGPVLIRYEDLLLSMIGGLLLLGGARWFASYHRKKKLTQAEQTAART